MITRLSFKIKTAFNVFNGVLTIEVLYYSTTTLPIVVFLMGISEGLIQLDVGLYGR